MLLALATYVAVFYRHPGRGSLCDRSSDGYSAEACNGATEDQNVVLVTGLAGIGLGIFGLIRRYPPRQLQLSN
jgi:hypothetical protein